MPPRREQTDMQRIPSAGTRRKKIMSISLVPGLVTCSTVVVDTDEKKRKKKSPLLSIFFYQVSLTPSWFVAYDAVPRDWIAHTGQGSFRRLPSS